MKSLMALLAAGVLVYFFWQRQESAAPEAIEDPVYGEIRMDLAEPGRDIQMALFARIPDHAECNARADLVWRDVFESCPACRLEPVQCHDQLPARYARLFDDVPIPSWYLSLKPGRRGEREARLVVYGLTDEEGAGTCQELIQVVKKKYAGTAECVAPAGE